MLAGKFHTRPRIFHSVIFFFARKAETIPPAIKAIGKI
jgi:hypothetical protein